MTTAVALPYTTQSTNLSVLDSDNPNRVREYLDAQGQINMLYKEHDGALVAILDKIYPNGGKEVSNPVITWTEDTRPSISTTFSAALTSTDTYLPLTDGYTATIGQSIFVPETNEILTVIDVDPDLSEGWANSGNIRVTRGSAGTAQAAIAAGNHANMSPPYMAELGDPQVGTGKVPNNEMTNFVSFVGETTKMSVMQMNSAMRNDFGTWPQAKIDTQFKMRQRMQHALLFESRRTSTGTDGAKYISGGLRNFIRTNYLDLGTTSSNANWETMNDFVENTYIPDGSSGNKVLMCGRNLFKSFAALQRANGRMEQQPYYEPAFTAYTFMLHTDGGYSLPVVQDRWGLSSDYGLADWGFLVDLGNIETYHFKGMNFQWIENIQERRSNATIREDMLVGSFGIIPRFEATHGIIRGGIDTVVSR